MQNSRNPIPYRYCNPQKMTDQARGGPLPTRPGCIEASASQTLPPLCCICAHNAAPPAPNRELARSRRASLGVSTYTLYSEPLILRTMYPGITCMGFLVFAAVSPEVGGSCSRPQVYRAVVMKEESEAASAPVSSSHRSSRFLQPCSLRCVTGAAGGGSVFF